MGKVIGNLTEYVKIFHANALDKGFYGSTFSMPKALLLLTCEISEAVEADRKGLHASSIDISGQYDSMCSGDSTTWIREFTATLKDTFEMELTDFFIRALDLYGYLQEKDSSIRPLQEALDYVSDGLQYLVLDMMDNSKLYSCPEEVLLMIEGEIASMRRSYDKDGYLCDVIYLIMYLAEHEYHFDIFKCAELKHAYNRTRKYLHGKNY